MSCFVRDTLTGKTVEIVVHDTATYTTYNPTDQGSLHLSWLPSTPFGEVRTTLDKLYKAIPAIASPAQKAFEEWLVSDIPAFGEFTDQEWESYAILHSVPASSDNLYITLLPRGQAGLPGSTEGISEFVEVLSDVESRLEQLQDSVPIFMRDFPDCDEKDQRYNRFRLYTLLNNRQQNQIEDYFTQTIWNSPQNSLDSLSKVPHQQLIDAFSRLSTTEEDTESLTTMKARDYVAPREPAKDGLKALMTARVFPTLSRELQTYLYLSEKICPWIRKNPQCQPIAIRHLTVMSEKWRWPAAIQTTLANSYVREDVLHFQLHNVERPNWLPRRAVAIMPTLAGLLGVLSLQLGTSSVHCWAEAVDLECRRCGILPKKVSNPRDSATN